MEGSKDVRGPAEAEIIGGVVSSYKVHRSGEQSASLSESLDSDNRNVSLCITQLIIVFCWCNHEYPRMACVKWSREVRRNWMVWCVEHGNSMSRSVY